MCSKAVWSAITQEQGLTGGVGSPLNLQSLERASACLQPVLSGLCLVVVLLRALPTLQHNMSLVRNVHFAWRIQLRVGCYPLNADQGVQMHAGPMYEKMFRAAGRREVVAKLQDVHSSIRWDSLR